MQEPAEQAGTNKNVAQTVEQAQQEKEQSQQVEENSNDSTSEQVKEQPKFVPGKLAVCMHCGYLSEDFNKCLRCKTKLPEDVKSVSVTTTNNKVVDALKVPEKKLSQKVDIGE